MEVPVSHILQCLIHLKTYHLKSNSFLPLDFQVCVCLFLYREQALLTARQEPVFSRDRVYERIRFPNVYDSFAEATKSPAFVGGSKVRLRYLNQ